LRAFLVLAVLLCAGLPAAQQNPFMPAQRCDAVDSSAEGSATDVREGRVRTRFSWAHVPFSQQLLSVQRRLVGGLSRALRTQRQKPGVAGVLFSLMLALVYGVVHSLGPGHGKLLFVSHTLARPSPRAAIWRAGALFAATHTGMALVAFLVLRVLLGQERGQIELYSQRMLRVSGILVALAGLLVLASPLLEKMVLAVAGRLSRSVASLNALAVIAGLSPCPGAFLILVFSSISGVLYLGVLAVVTVSVGMAVTVSMFGHLGGLVEAHLRTGQQNKVWLLLHDAVRYLGAAAIIALGLLMALG
jgi:nickel/cobalt exporter